MTDLVIAITEDKSPSPAISPNSQPLSPFHLSPEHKRGLKQTNSFTLCGDLIDYFDNKFVHQAHDILEELREERPKSSVASLVNSLCTQINSLTDILTSLQQDLINQLLKNVDIELRIFNDRIHKATTQEEVNRYSIDIIQQLVFLLENIMQAEQKDIIESNDLIDMPAIANLESHVFDEEWRRYLKPRTFATFHFSPQRSCSLSMARKSIDLRRSLLADSTMLNDAELRIPRKKDIHTAPHRDSDGYGSSTSSSSRPTSQDIEEYISVEELNQIDHMRIFSASTTSLDSGFQADHQFPYLPQLELQEWGSAPYSRSTFSLNSTSTESDEDMSNELLMLSSPAHQTPTESITLGRGVNTYKRGTLKRDRRGSSMEMGIALEYIKFRVSTAKKHQVVSKQQKDIDMAKSLMFVIQVESNMEDIVPHNFNIIRTFEEFQSFYLEVLNKHGKIDNYPKQPWRSIKTKNFERKVDDILNTLGKNSQTRNADYLINFIKMDNGLALATDGIDKNLQVEKTFFTPSINSTPGTVPLKEVPFRPRNFHSSSVKLERNNTLTRSSLHSSSPPPSPSKLINRVKQGGREVLITTTERNHEFIDAATLDILIENLTTLDQSRDNTRVPDPNFIQQFILGHRHFLKNDEFLSILLKKFEDINENNSMKDQSKTWQMLAKIRLLNVIIQWIETFYPDFYTSPGMKESLTRFIEDLKEMNEAKSSIQRIQKILQDQQNYFDSKIGSNDRRLSKNPSVLLGTTLLTNHKFKPEYIAQQLSLIQMELFKKVGFYEICIKILEGNNSKKNGICTPNLDAFIGRSNQESTWVMSEILFAETAKVRIEVAEMAISVAKHCYRLKNYNTLMAILASLQNRLVNRTKVISLISEKSKNTFEKLKRVMDFSGNFKNYRQETRTLLSEDNKPCVPFFALYMKDFTHMNENKKYVGDGLINFSKIRNMHKSLIELKKLQRFPYVDLKEDPDLNMRVQNLYTLSDEKLEDISQKLTKKKCTTAQI